MSAKERTEKLIWEAVQEAQVAGISPKELVVIARDAWADARKQDSKVEMAEFNDLLRPRLVGGV